jgi:hypothetical protein
VGFEPVDFARGRARHRADHLTVDDELELVILSGDGDNLAEPMCKASSGTAQQIGFT